MKTTYLFRLKKLLSILAVGFFFLSCQKELDEPKHKNKGKNIIYLKIDEQDFLIKEGFSLNRNVIRADIGGVSSRAEPTYNEGDYFGRKTSSLAFNFSPKKGDDKIGPSSIDIQYFVDDFGCEGLFNAINIDFFSEKHNSNISIWKKGYGWNGEFSPEIQILKFEPDAKIISGTVFSNYADFNDSTKKGSLYLYFDLTYDII